MKRRTVAVHALLVLALTTFCAMAAPPSDARLAGYRLQVHTRVAGV
jgi:hypothetical protein